MSDDIRSAVIDALLEVAPEVDPSSIDDAVPLQEQVDIDSLDFLVFLEGVAERTGVEVAEQAYEQIATLDGLTSYVAAQAP